MTPILASNSYLFWILGFAAFLLVLQPATAKSRKDKHPDKHPNGEQTQESSSKRDKKAEQPAQPAPEKSEEPKDAGGW